MIYQTTFPCLAIIKIIFENIIIFLKKCLFEMKNLKENYKRKENLLKVVSCMLDV
jgi:hypothetical protein